MKKIVERYFYVVYSCVLSNNQVWHSATTVNAKDGKFINRAEIQGKLKDAVFTDSGYSTDSVLITFILELSKEDIDAYRAENQQINPPGKREKEKA